VGDWNLMNGLNMAGTGLDSAVETGLARVDAKFILPTLGERFKQDLNFVADIPRLELPDASEARSSFAESPDP
jgi:hypothetical protein